MLKAAIRKGTLANELNPVLVGSAYKNKGVQELLDAVVDYLPSPLDVPAVEGTNPKTGETETREASADAPFAALAFKIATDPFVGKLSFFRVYSGHVDAGSYETGETETREASADAPFAALAFKIATDPFVGKLSFFRVYSGHVDAGSYVVNATNGNRERFGRIFAALAFKIATDPFVGKLSFFRVYSGHVDAGSYVVNATNGNRERFGRILEMNANDRVDVDGASALSFFRVYSGHVDAGSYVVNATNGNRERFGRILEMNANDRVDVDGASAGDILAAVGLKNTTTGDTLCQEGKEIILEQIEFAKPVIDIAIEPKTKAEQDKMSIALTKLAEEDPTFQVSTNHETGQTIIAGMGELHLEIIVDRLLREFKVEANVGKPQVAYREAPGHDVEKAEGKFVRQSGGRGQYGHAVIKLEKMEEGFGDRRRRRRPASPARRPRPRGHQPPPPRHRHPRGFRRRSGRRSGLHERHRPVRR